MPHKSFSDVEEPRTSPVEPLAKRSVVFATECRIIVLRRGVDLLIYDRKIVARPHGPGDACEAVGRRLRSRLDLDCGAKAKHLEV
jgi:hypothetical protein